MPSSFIREQAELLYRSKNPTVILENLRFKYAESSFASQMTRVKEEWCKYSDRHEDFETSFQEGLKSLKKQGVSSKCISKYEEFGRNDLCLQLKQLRTLSKNGLTGSSRADAIMQTLPLML